MFIRKAEFLESSHTLSKCSNFNLPEYAFIGRSNVGKSSLINMLTKKKDLAKTSSSPGKTQCLNFFNINDEFIITDLPGYGYAKVSKSRREDFGELIRNYILKRESLMDTFVLVDSRISLQKKDLDFMIWLNDNKVSFCIVFTKIDRLSKNKLNNYINQYKKEIGKYWEILPNYFLTSSSDSLGREEILNYIENLNKLILK